MITILTRSPQLFNFERIKWELNRFLKRKRGPAVVLESLKRGFQELGVAYQVNPSICNISKTVHVISGVKALEWAITEKKRGRITRLVAGPNLVVLPNEAKGIMYKDEIDVILFPCQWCKDLWVSIDESFRKKVSIWYAGVHDPAVIRAKNQESKCIIYQKNSSAHLFEFIKREAEKNFDLVEIFIYGQFEQNKFFKCLESASAMIYLSQSESQGMALHEAWIRGVPTLVWNRGYFYYKGLYWYAPKISAPYLTEGKCGIFFESEDNFREKLSLFRKDLGTYEPRTYSLERFTDRISVINYLKKIQP